MKDPYQEIRDKRDKALRKNKREFIISVSVVVFVIILVFVYAIYYVCSTKN